MRRSLIPLLLGAFLLALCGAFTASCEGGKCPVKKLECPALKVRDEIRSMSVTIEVETDRGMGKGSGTLFVESKGDCYCLTAAHVVASAKFVKAKQYKSDKDGKETVKWVFAKVVKTSPEHDIALLDLGSSLALGHSVKCKFYKDKEPPREDTPILHCGSFIGTLHHSIAAGEIICLGRPDIGNYKFKDQLDMTGFPGSSGGGVFLKDGTYIGMVTHFFPQQPRIWFMTPMRVIRSWAEKEGIEKLFGFPDRGLKCEPVPPPCCCCP